MDFVHRGRHTPVLPKVAPNSPLLSSAPWFPAAGGAFGLAYAVGLSGSALLFAPRSLLLFGLWRASLGAFERHRLRRAADAWIARGHDESSAWYGWRIAELTARRERKLLARSLRSVVGDLSSRGSTAAAPLNRAGLRPNSSLLLELAERLDALERPVRAAGVLSIQRLITSPDSPLYRPPVFNESRAVGRTVSECAGRIRAALDGLEVC